jgi:hypothetical protein
VAVFGGRAGASTVKNAVLGLGLGASLRLGLCASMGLGLVGCKVGGDDIEHWKTTVKGPGKIVAVMLADKYPLELRTQAALALVAMERNDRDVLADLQSALGRLDDTTRGQIVTNMVPGIESQLVAKDAKGEGPTARTQARAKDAAFLLVTQAPTEVKAKLTQDVVGWYMADFNGRSLAGNYSAEQVVRALGSPGAKVLVSGLKAQMPPAALVKMAQLIAQVAEPASRREAAQKLVAIEREMEGAKFLDWVRETVAEQAAASSVKLDAKKLAAAAAVNRDNFINEGALPALKWLADEPVVKARLLEIASDKSGKDDSSKARRARALAALEGKVTSADLTHVLALALDSDNPPDVRDYAFDRVGDIRSSAALPQLWPLVASSSDEKLRWRAGELVLSISGASAINELFAKLPAGGEFPPEELEGYAQRIGQISPAPAETMQRLLDSKDWFARVVALRYFERKGSASDLTLVTRLKDDSAAVKGKNWGKTKTVGDVADEVAASLKQRNAQPSSP